MGIEHPHQQPKATGTRNPGQVPSAGSRTVIAVQACKAGARPGLTAENPAMVLPKRVIASGLAAGLNARPVHQCFAIAAL
jgi:hypothetical protein